MFDRPVLDLIGREAIRLDAPQYASALMHAIGDASIVLLGEATHGSEEFYRTRARITQMLMTEKNFDAVAVEADWPDAARVNRYVRDTAGLDPANAQLDLNAQDALQDFTRFPLWMWRNRAVADFVAWLREFNLRHREPQHRIGFYGLDLYNLRASIDAVISYLDKVDPDEAKLARARYSCFDHMAHQPQRYGYATSFGMKEDCREQVTRQLLRLHEDAAKFLKADGPASAQQLFHAQQSARVAKDAEAYYRAMVVVGDTSWNLRDTHMCDTLQALRAHLSQQHGRPAKIVVWAHNSHIGDARATEMGDRGQINLGQLVRERYPSRATFSMGFTTHAGTVTAASEWDEPAHRKSVRPSRPESTERLLHETGAGDFFLPLQSPPQLREALTERRLERAIGVIYLPANERASHYFYASLPDQFDAVIHIDKTSALHPLDKDRHWQSDEIPETYPTGI